MSLLWQCGNNVKKIEDKFWEKDGLMEDAIEDFVRFGDDSDSDDDGLYMWEPAQTTIVIYPMIKEDRRPL